MLSLLKARGAKSVRKWSPQGLLETAYKRAAQEWDDRMGSALVQAYHWPLACFALAAGFALQTLGAPVGGRDRVAVALGSVLAAGVVVPQGNVSGYVPTVGQGMAANAAGAVNQAGQQITTRALNIQPTIKVRPEFSVNVLVTKDLVIPP